MRIDKIMIVAAAAMLTIACTDDVVSRKQYDALKEEYKELKENKEALQGDYTKQNEEIGRILEELAVITGSTASLRTDVETGKADIRQAEQISSSIASIKTRLDELEKSTAYLNSKNKEFKKMVDGLKNVISEQEAQIQNLTEEIKAKDATIQAQGEVIKDHEATISTQSDKIKQQNEELRKTVEHQAKMLYDAGVMLESIADNVPDVKFKKNKEKVDVMAQDIYRKALSYYQQASAAGCAEAAAAIDNVRAKIQAE